jgi:hypothetical protein
MDAGTPVEGFSCFGARLQVPSRPRRHLSKGLEIS